MDHKVIIICSYNLLGNLTFEPETTFGPETIFEPEILN